MRSIFILCFLVVSLVSAGQSVTRSALFLGNSYTASNNLPELVSQLAESAGDKLDYGSNTPGGYTLQSHTTNTTSVNQIMQGGWDFVVLQEQSQRPSFPLWQVQQDVFPYARHLDSVINEYNPCGETMFFMTWGRKNGDSYNCASWPPVCTYEGMDSLLHLRYMMMADSNNAVVSPVGAVWHYIRDNFPSISLYSSDESHPSQAGSYAAACTFYSSMFRKDPGLITYDFTLNSTDAANIRSAVKAVVYDSLLKWNIGAYDVLADFDYSKIQGYQYEFTNFSKNSTQWFWEIEGMSYSSEHVSHTFSAPGTYNVMLSSADQCDTSVVTKAVIVDTISAVVYDKSHDIRVYPNPAGDYLNISGLKDVQQIRLYSSPGKLVATVVPESEVAVIDLSGLAAGFYVVRVFTTNQNYQFKLIRE